MCQNLIEIMKQARDAIIRPRRKKYPLSMLKTNFVYESLNVVRLETNYINSRKQKLVGSLYFLEGNQPKPNDPCVIYLHGNASSQLEGRFLIPNLCPHGISVFCFDFAGCGNSDGEYISLGYYESIDTNFIINSLKNQYGFDKFILWGRSLGAATAIIKSNKYVIAKICDS